MVGTSPPRYRHDGTSPLPLGMDASPAPLRWVGPRTVWPHDPRTGWSYCIMVPSWIVLPEAKVADGNFINPTVFYKVQVAIQSPQGVSTVRGILRRFSDFLRLYAALKRIFPKKRIPAAPPKNSLMRINSSQAHLQERRLALIDWMSKLMADIEISRSAPMASFLELEAAARSAMKAQQSTTFGDASPESGVSCNRGSSFVTSEGLSSGVECGSDVLYDTSGIGTSNKRSEQSFEIELEDLVLGQQAPADEGGPDITDNMQDTEYKEELHFLGVDSQILERQDALSLKDIRSTNEDDILEVNSIETMKAQYIQENGVGKVKSLHGRRASVDSITSVVSPGRGSELSYATTGDGPSEGLSWGHSVREKCTEILPGIDAESLKDVQLALPMDQRGKVKMVLMTLQRRWTTAKADIEDLIARWNQEIAVREFLAMKVRDLEAELDNTRRKSREALQRAVSMEREGVTNLQWELEECRTALMSAHELAQGQQELKAQAEERLQMAEVENRRLEQDLGELREKYKNLQKDKENIELKARADMRVLAKEIKSLRKSQPELKEELEVSLQANAQLEAELQEERDRQEKQRTFRTQFLHELDTLRQRLRECSVEFLAKEEDMSIKSPTVHNAMDLLTTSDNRIGLLLAEAQLLAEEKEENGANWKPIEKVQLPNGLHDSGSTPSVQMRRGQEKGSEGALLKMLTEMFLDNAQLRKAVNSLTLNSLLMASKQEGGGADEAPTRKSVLNKFL